MLAATNRENSLIDFMSLTSLKTASHLQNAVFQHVADQIVSRIKGEPIKNLVVEATAGSGKTTTSVAIADLFTSVSIQAIMKEALAGSTTKVSKMAMMQTMKVIFLAFNKSIKLELDERLNFGEAKTLNGLGHGIYARHFQSLHGSQINFVKDTKINTLMGNLYSYEERQAYGEDVVNLVKKAISAGVAPSMSPLPSKGVNDLTDSDETLSTLCDHYGIEITPAIQPTIFRMVREVLAADFNDEKNVSYDDQKWFVVVKRTENGNPINCPKYDAVLVDEAQDLSDLDAALVQMICKKNSIVVFVGDREQSLYGFRGASADSIDNLIRDFKAGTLPLSITYRCGKKIVEEARTVSTRIEAREGAHEGLVKTLNRYDATAFDLGDKIVCRNNAPLVSMAFKLIGARVPVQMMGRDLGKNLITIIQKCSGKKNGKAYDFTGKTTVDLVTDLKEWLDTQREVILAKNPNNESGVQSLQDRYDTIMVFVGQNTDKRIQSVIDDISSLFGTKEFGEEKARNDKVVLSTVHKAKGLEADVVFILDRHLFMPKRVPKGTWQYEQEKNIVFVAITRAKYELYYIGTDGYR